MTALSKCLLFALCLTMASCASTPRNASAYLPPRIDCAELDPPRKTWPVEPQPYDKTLISWQLYAYALGDYAESLLEQRIATAACMAQNRKAGNIR